jgi:hypothetical protein
MKVDVLMENGDDMVMMRKRALQYSREPVNGRCCRGFASSKESRNVVVKVYGV